MTVRRAKQTFTGVAAVLWVSLGLAACSKQQEVITQTVADQPLTDEQIDADPWALLPGGAVGWIFLDAQRLLTSPFGAQILQLARQRSFILPSAGFEPSRDLTAICLGLYSMQGADFAGVAKGRFDARRIDQTADGTQMTGWGSAIERTSYSGRTVYVASDIAYSVLTPGSVLFGNQTGVRRALDRIREGRVRRRVPAFIDELFRTPNAPLAMGLDFRAHPVPVAARRELSFMQGLEMAKVVGNFRPPGLNLAGTVSYEDEAAASAGADRLRRLGDLVSEYGWLMSALGMSQPIRKLEATAQGSDSQFVLAVDSPVVVTLLDQLARVLAASAASAQGN